MGEEPFQKKMGEEKRVTKIKRGHTLFLYKMVKHKGVNCLFRLIYCHVVF
jgi:hypothetical protein